MKIFLSCCFVLQSGVNKTRPLDHVLKIITRQNSHANHKGCLYTVYININNSTTLTPIHKFSVCVVLLY